VTALRLSCFYGSFFAVTGVQLPFWPVWLDAKGLDASTLGLVMAMSFAAKALSTPLVAHFADRTGERKRLIVALAFCSFAGFSLFYWVNDFWPLVAVSLLFFAAWPPVMSLTETVAMRADQQKRINYGRVRLWGSLSFIVLAILSGRVLVDAPPAAIYWMVLAGLGLTCVATLFIPNTLSARHAGPRSPWSIVLTNRRLVLMLLACGLIQSSHAVYYGFATLYWESLGLRPDVIGGLWAEGVIAEIILFAVGHRLLRHISPGTLLMIAGIACIVRWTGTAFAETLPALIALQVLHAFSFGAAHLGAMHIITREAPEAQSATAQSFYSSLVWGVGLGIALYAAGYLYEAYSGVSFLAMAVLGMGGLVFAIMLSAAQDTAQK
jgi:PPP family 3-phenylpropionic acid transporter